MNRLSHPISHVLCCFIAAASILIAAPPARAADSPETLKIIYTNDTLGYLEPCGCGGRYQGGLARRTTAIAEILKADSNVVIVDSGNISNMESKLALMIPLMAAMRYDALGIGGSDRLFSDEFLRQAEKSNLNVIDTTRPKGASTAPCLIKQVDGIKVGIVSYGKTNATSDDRSVFDSAYKSARASCDLIILLDQGGIATTQWLQEDAIKLGAPDIVIGGASKGIIATEKIIGKTHVVPVLQLGRQIGIIDVDMSDRQSPSMSVRMQIIDRKIAEDEAVKQQVDDFIQKPKTLAAFAPSILNFGTIKKGTKKEEYVTLAPIGSTEFTIAKATSSGQRVSAPDWKGSMDSSYRIKVVIDGTTPGRVLETLSFTLGLPGDPSAGPVALAAQSTCYL